MGKIVKVKLGPRVQIVEILGTERLRLYRCRGVENKDLELILYRRDFSATGLREKFLGAKRAPRKIRSYLTDRLKIQALGREMDAAKRKESSRIR